MKNLLPRFSDLPFKKIKIPDDLYSEIMEEYKQMKFTSVKCDHAFSSGYDDYSVDGVGIKFSKSPYYFYSKISQELIGKCELVIKPMIEEWSNTKLIFNNGYGIRSYVNNSVLHWHRDVIRTHVVSCNIFVDEYPNTGWTFDILDHDKNLHRVSFEPGDMVFYESLCAHARMSPFKGEYYRNMYLHWKPVNWDASFYAIPKQEYSCLQEILDEQ
jgi:prolyl 4-hydroxylase